MIERRVWGNIDRRDRGGCRLHRNSGWVEYFPEKKKPRKKIESCLYETAKHE